MLEKWFSKDGLMRLTPSETASQEDTDNDNGILFTAEFYMLRKLNGAYEKNRELEAEDSERWIKAVRAIWIAEFPGLTHRNPGRTNSLNSHDNLAGLYCGCVIFGKYGIIEDIVQHGLISGFTYNNEAPASWRLRAWIQGAEIFALKLCGGFTPTIFNTIWFAASTIYNTFQFKRLAEGIWHSETNLVWLRFRAILLAEKKKRNGWNKHFYDLTKWLFKFWRWRLLAATDQKGMQVPIDRYFLHPDNPIHAEVKGFRF